MPRQSKFIPAVFLVFLVSISLPMTIVAQITNLELDSARTLLVSGDLAAFWVSERRSSHE